MRAPPGCNGYVCDEEMATKVVLITGSSSGIGLATAVLLAYDTEKRFESVCNNEKSCEEAATRDRR